MTRHPLPRFHLLAIPVGLALAGCSAQGPNEPDALSNAVQRNAIQLVVDRATYQRGDTLAATVENETSLQLIHGACSLVLQQKREGAWVPAEQLVGFCTMQAFVVRPGASEALRKILQSGLTPGEYRVVLTLSVDEPSKRREAAVPSNSFHVD